MLSKMRDHRKNRVMQVIVYSMFAIIIIVFAISFGPGAWGQGGLTSATHAAKVNGTIITAMEFQRAYGDYLEHYRRLVGESLPADQAREMGIKRQILDSLIDRKLVVQHAPKMGIQVPDAEVSRTLREIEAFHTAGRFDQELFERYVRNVMGSSTGRFFERVRKDMLYQRVLDAVRSAANVTPGEVWNRFVEDNDKVDLEYVRVSPIQFRDKVEVADEQIEDVLAERRDEVEAYYERNSFRYKKPERVRARHILISTDSDAAGEDRETARAKAAEVLAQAREGADFAKLAEEHSDDPGSKTRGGDLDWFPRGQMVPAFEEAAFSLAPGELSDIVETPFVYHVILVEDRRDATEQPIEEVEREIAADILKGELAKEHARAEASSILEQAKGGKALAEIVGEEEEGEGAADQPLELTIDGALDLELEEARLQEQLAAATPKRDSGLHASTTGLRAIRGGEVSGIGRSHELVTKVNALAEEGSVVPDVVEVGGSFYVVRLIERRRPDPDAFESEKESIRDELLRARKTHVEDAFMSALRDEARIQVNEAMLEM